MGLARLSDSIVVLVLALCSAGCLGESSVTCADGTLCPGGLVCAASGDGFRCVSPDQLTACEGKIDGAVCTLTGAGDGACRAGLCVVVGCGDGVTDPREICDDGNNISGDGCRLDCQKVEVCGDAILDEGEACDDGNENSADGCDGCVATQWSASAVIGAGGSDAVGESLNSPADVAIDDQGNLFIADRFNHRIRRVDATTGVITTVAGDGTEGFSGDGGAATSAQLGAPAGLAVDGLGNIFLADTRNHRIRRVDAGTGVITTVAGDGTLGFSGDDGAATSAKLARPSDVAVDGLGNLFFAGDGNHRVRRVDAVSGIITTIAGDGTGAFSGDGGVASSAQLNSPAGLALDGLGNLFIADTLNQRIRRVDAAGIISTVAGNGIWEFSGDDGAATSAKLALPSDVAVDGLGNLFIAGEFSARIRRVDAAGIITTIAGDGTVGFSGDNGAATSAQLRAPEGVAVDGWGNLFIADTANHSIRRVDAVTDIITTVAGDGRAGGAGDGGAATSAQLSAPAGVAVDGLGNLFIADTVNNRIRRVDAVTGIITTVAGDGSAGFSGDGDAATSAQLIAPAGVAVDGLGNLFIADTVNNRIRRVDAVTGLITTVAGDGMLGFSGDGDPATSAQLRAPAGVAVDGLGNLFLADEFNNRIRRVDAVTGLITTVAGDGTVGFLVDNIAATSAQLDLPAGVALDDDGNLFLADQLNHRIRRVDAVTGVITTVAGDGTAGFSGDGGAATSAQLSSPSGVAVGSFGKIFIADSGNHRIRRVDAVSGIIITFVGDGTAGFSGDNGAPTSAQLSSPSDVAVDIVGTLFLADTDNHRIRRVNAFTGLITTYAGDGTAGFSGDGGAATGAQLNRPTGVAVDGLGGLFLADRSNLRIRRINASGVITTVAGDGTFGFSGDGGAATSAQLSFTTGVAVDASGNLFLADTDNDRIRRVDAASGVITTFSGDGTAGFSGDDGAATSAQLNRPAGVAVDASGDLFLADTDNDRIRRVDDATGVITTVAGNGTSGLSGDDGAATSAQINRPTGVAVDASGNLFLADTDNDRIRRVDAATGIITTVAGADDASTMPDSHTGIAVDAVGNLFFSDLENHSIRRIDAATGDVTIAAGDGTHDLTSSEFDRLAGDGSDATMAQLSRPTGVTVDGFGNLFFADEGNHRVRRVDAATGVITTVAGDVHPIGAGPLEQAKLADPRAISLWSLGTLFAAGVNGLVQATHAVRGVLENVAGQYPQPEAAGNSALYGYENFGEVAGVAYDAARELIYLTETFDDPNPSTDPDDPVLSKHRIHVVNPVDPEDRTTWTIATLAGDEPEFADGTAGDARFRNPTDLYLDDAGDTLYVLDTGNHVIRAIDLSSGIASATVTTFAGRPETLGFFGDDDGDGNDDLAIDALFFQPQAMTQCANGDVFVSDTGNNRVRRIESGTGIITTVLGDGVAASSGQGTPARNFPVHTPLGLACDALGNLFVTSTTTLRMLPADDDGVVDGSGPVQTIYDAAPRTEFPEAVTFCLTDVEVIDDTTLWITDSCTGILIALSRQ